MSTPDNNELKERERCAWASVADGWKRRDELLRKGAAPVTERMLAYARDKAARAGLANIEFLCVDGETLVNQLDNETRQAYINDVIQTADALKQGNTLCMRGTTWLASAEK